MDAQSSSSPWRFERRHGTSTGQILRLPPGSARLPPGSARPPPPLPDPEEGKDGGLRKGRRDPAGLGWSPVVLLLLLDSGRWDKASAHLMQISHPTTAPWIPMWSSTPARCDLGASRSVRLRRIPRASMVRRLPERRRCAQPPPSPAMAASLLQKVVPWPPPCLACRWASAPPAQQINGAGATYVNGNGTAAHSLLGSILS